MLQSLEISSLSLTMLIRFLENGEAFGSRICNSWFGFHTVKNIVNAVKDGIWVHKLLQELKGSC